ncbi:hypothetical protein ISF_01862 [Cordyceps fumosorosea ARSEF 2679]|uniref:Uncharacterized protein n=1 Tax=Cordyceps fumosorosea (strain ARSEF 2679) TaxID=1081104 RepID=A0A168CFH8_CORFA|nr:hypothetical protein ISF_01862 [Cordyceps fumosorosea ARSEF 2679]OAA71311.1 hypothetical protein ISF_01862 [Cordyceps fumosorosea ARSEF 2679]
MERPRNRQPRPPRGNDRGGRGGRGRGGGGQHHRPPATPQQAAGTVPTIRQVVPGAGVFIILKEDQPTGRETRGVVDEVLTAGNHPRGIKVRLRDSQVGRVQRLDKTPSNGEDLPSSENDTGLTTEGPARRGGGSTRFSHRYTDVRNDDYLEGPPERSLADFLPPGFGESTAPKQAAAPTVTCPMCQDFEGDETAVTHHIDQVHLS